MFYSASKLVWADIVTVNVQLRAELNAQEPAKGVGITQSTVHTGTSSRGALLWEGIIYYIYLYDIPVCACSVGCDSGLNPAPQPLASARLTALQATPGGFMIGDVFFTSLFALDVLVRICVLQRPGGTVPTHVYLGLRPNLCLSI